MGTFLESLRQPPGSEWLRSLIARVPHAEEDLFAVL